MSSKRVDSLAAAANYLAINLLYLKRYVAPGEPVRSDDSRGFAPGHWGCVPGLNAIWANLAVSSHRRGRSFVPIVGTGHGSAAWVSWCLLRDATQAGGLHRPALDLAAQEFGIDDRLPHELFGPVPGIVYPTGELGSALAFAEGAADAVDAPVVALIGDGEMETGTTLSAMTSARAFRRAPIVVVNANGYRMGDRSWWATLPEDGRHFAESLGWRHLVAADGNDNGPVFDLALTTTDPTLVVYKSEKGAGIPRREASETSAKTVHKLPITQLRTDDDVQWLRRWLDCYSTSGFEPERIRADAAAAAWKPLSSAYPVRHVEPATAVALSAVEAETSQVRRFIMELTRQHPDLLITSPDEAASNRVDIADVQVAELLSEQVTLAWAFGAAAAGRPALWATYEAFAPIATTLVAQYARHQGSCRADGRAASFPIVLSTSLSMRNVPSHQDVSFVADLEQRQLRKVRVLVPPSMDHVEAAAARSAATAFTGEALPVVVIDKYPNGTAEHADLVECSEPGWEIHRFGPGHGNAAAIVALGAAAFREATLAARHLANTGLSCEVAVLCEWSAESQVVDGGPVFDLLTGARAVAAMSTLPSLTFTKVIGTAKDRLTHTAIYSPTPGPNHVARLMANKLDWCSAAAALATSKEHVEWLTALRDAIRTAMADDRIVDWFTNLTLDEVIEQFDGSA